MCVKKRHHVSSCRRAASAEPAVARFQCASNATFWLIVKWLRQSPVSPGRGRRSHSETTLYILYRELLVKYTGRC
jgi:hypothetical protein